MTTLPIFGAVEDLLLGILRPVLEPKGVHVYAEFEEHMQLPAVVPLSSRRSGTTAFDGADVAHMRTAVIEMNTICDGPDSAKENAELQEACRHVIINAWRNQTVVEGAGVINRIDNSTIATHVTDWATSTGVVQYANLPNGAERYEAVYRLLIRPPTIPAPNRFM